MLIYVVENLVNGKILIGQTIRRLCERKGQYLYQLRRDEYHNIHFQRAFNKYGEESFEFKVLEDGFECRKELNEAETFWILTLGSMNSEYGYNKSDGGKKRITDGYRKRISRALKGKKFSKERCKNISEALRGREFSKEHKENLSKSRIGKRNHFYGKEHTKESKRKMSETTKGMYSGDKNPMYGKSGVSSPCAKGVKQIDKNTGETLNIFDYILEATRETGIDNSSISKACKGKLKTAGGFKWKYYDD